MTWARAALMGLPTAVAVASASAQSPTNWPDLYETRLEALALLQTLNADLLAHDSATLTLDRWCETHRLASPARIVAERVTGADKPPTDRQRQDLAVGPADAVRYRRVRLHCGEHVLSEADNWYVPGRLTDEMNAVLDTTDTSFGRAVQALHFRRQTLSATVLWEPLPPGWEMGAALPPPGGSLAIPAKILEHRAVLLLPDGTPFSEVVETYTGALFSFPPR